MKAAAPLFNMTSYPLKLEILGTILLGAIVGFQLFVPPQLGMADSADYGRLMTRIGLVHHSEDAEDIYLNYFNTSYTEFQEPKFPVKVGQIIPLLSLGINNLFHSGKTYSIFYLSSLYLLLYLGGFYLFIKNALKKATPYRILRIFLVFCSILIFSDILFVAYLNSFYQETLFIIVSFYVIAEGLRSKMNYDWMVFLLVLLSLTKAQNMLFLIIPFIIIILKFKKLNKIILGGTFSFFLFFFFFVLKEQAQTNQANLYEAVFLGLMYDSEPLENQKILRDLDLEEEGYLVNVRRGYWRPNNEIIDNKKLFREFYTKVDHGAVVKAYFLNPEVFLKTMLSGLKIILTQSAQPQGYGNYKQEIPYPQKKAVKTSLWSAILPVIVVPLYLLTFLYFLSPGKKRITDRIDKLLIILGLWIPLVFTANIVAGGINDFVKHNLSVYLMLSFLFILLVLKFQNIFYGRLLNLSSLKRSAVMSNQKKLF